MKMATSKVNLVIFFSLFQLVYGNVPVLIWESTKSDRGIECSASALHRMSEPEFEQCVLKKVHGEQPPPLLVVFLEESLSLEDFSWQDSLGQGYFTGLKYIVGNAASSTFLPSVQDPIGAIKKLSQFGYSLQTIDQSKIADLSDGCQKILMINYKDDNQEDDRNDILRRHDGNMVDIYSGLLSKCSHVIAVLSAQQPSWVEPDELTRLRRSADDNSTSVSRSYTLYQDTRGVSMVYSSQVPKLFLDGKEVTLQNTSYVTSGDNAKSNYIKLFAKYGNEYRLTFNFDNITNGYWYLRSIDLTVGVNENYVMKSMLDIYAPLGMSYHCGTPVVFRNETKQGVKELIFSDLQVEPFFSKPGSKSFSDAMDEVPFFTPAIWSGIFVTFLLALIFTWGISMIMDIRTMDQFDDPKGKTITVSATD